MRCPLPTLLVLLAAACSVTPRPREPEWVGETRRVTAIDMGLQSSSRRLDNLTKRLREMPAELLRVGNLEHSAGLLESPVARTKSLQKDLLALVGTDLSRTPHLPAGMLPTPDGYARDLADDLATTLLLLQGMHRPLVEIDDYSNRTSPDDDHPEASWWDRIRRRLRL